MKRDYKEPTKIKSRRKDGETVQGTSAVHQWMQTTMDKWYWPEDYNDRYYIFYQAPPP